MPVVGLDLVVDDGQLAAVEHGAGIRRQRVDLERSDGHALVDLRQLLLRQVEQHRDRLDGGDDDDAEVVSGRSPDCLRRPGACAGAAGDRRG